MDRRRLIFFVAGAGGTAALLAATMGDFFPALLVTAFVIGGCSNPLYSLLIAYTNDFLETDDMASASGGLLFINGVGAIMGPLLIGWALEWVGAHGFFLLIAVWLLAMAAHAAWRMTQRAAPSVEDTGAFAPIHPAATPVAVEVAQEYAIEVAEEEAEEEAAAAEDEAQTTP